MNAEVLDVSQYRDELTLTYIYMYMYMYVDKMTNVASDDWSH